MFGDQFEGPLSNAERVAFLVIIGENEGGALDWSSMSWKERT